MNRSHHLILSVAVLFSVIGCDASPFRMYSARTDAHFEKAKNDIHEAANSTAEALASVRVDYVNESQAKLNALDKQYGAIKEQGKTQQGKQKQNCINAFKPYKNAERVYASAWMITVNRMIKQQKICA